MKEEKDILDYLKVNRTDQPDASYFQNLAKEVIKSQEPKVIPMYRKPFFWIGSVAAIFIGFMVMIGFGDNVTSTDNPLFALNDVSSEEIIQYVDEHIEEFEIEEIASILSTEALETTESYELAPVVEEKKEEAQINEPTVDMKEIDSDEILEYLDNEGIELFELDEIELI